MQERDMPALVATSPAGTLPILGNNDVNVVFGDPIEGEVMGGFRGDYGKWVSNNVGLGGRFWILSENSESFSANGDGTNISIGRPFFNTNSVAGAQEDSLLIAITGNPGGNDQAGSVSGESTIDVWAAEGYGRVRFSCAKNCRLDFIGGYTHFNIEDSLRMTSTTITTNPATGQTRTYNDLFDTENKFHGGQLGFEMVLTRGRWMARSLTKVHLGNMDQRVRIAGNSFDSFGAPQNTNGGFLALGNQGDFQRDVFAFAPEANFKLAYRFRPKVLLSVGYSFLYWDNVALVSDQVDRVIDGTQLNQGPPFASRPAFLFNDSSLWVQGLDLGVVVDF